jgi:rRNA maturation protein Nop10
MVIDRGPELLLTFNPVALERCFLPADILREDFDHPVMEYGLIGLADERAPFHVLATPLLVGQSVSPATVKQPGRQVLRMRDEIEAISRRMRRRLVPISFIHRHNACCEASITDRDFLRGVFVDQVSTVVSFEELRRIDAGGLACACTGMQRLIREASARNSGPVEFRGEYGVAFSLIVNQMRDHRIYAVQKATCPFCGRSEVSEVPARISPNPRFLVSSPERLAMRSQLKREIEAKVRFEQHREVIGVPPC